MGPKNPHKTQTDIVTSGFPAHEKTVNAQSKLASQNSQNGQSLEVHSRESIIKMPDINLETYVPNTPSLCHDRRHSRCPSQGSPHTLTAIPVTTSIYPRASALLTNDSQNPYHSYPQEEGGSCAYNATTSNDFQGNLKPVKSQTSSAS